MWTLIIGYFANNPGVRGACRQVCRAWYKADLEVNLPLHKGLVQVMGHPLRLLATQASRFFYIAEPSVSMERPYERRS